MNSKYLITAASLAALLGTSPMTFAESSAKPKSADMSTAISDAAITTKIKAGFVGDDALKGSDISVTTANGVVSLTGTAKTSDARDKAEDLTRQVDGVRNVDNLLEVPGSVGSDLKQAGKKSEQVVSDGWITTKVKSSLLADGATKGTKISVKTVNRVVILSGNANSQAEADKAVEIAKGIKGVENVEASALKVSSKS